MVNGVGAIVAGFGRLARPLETGLVRTYALMILFGAVVLLGYVLYGQS